MLVLGCGLYFRFRTPCLGQGAPEIGVHDISANFQEDIHLGRNVCYYIS